MKKTAKTTVRVSRGTSSVKIYRWKHPSSGRLCWRFAWLDAGKWRYVTRSTRDEAELAAQDVLKEQSEGLVWSALSPARRRFLEEVHRQCREEDQGTFLMFLHSRAKSGEIRGAVDRFSEWMETTAGEVTPWVRQVNAIAKRLGESFAGRAVVDVHLADLKAWWEADSAGKSAKTRQSLRSVLVSIWNWFQREGLAGMDAVTVAERLPVVATAHGERRILSVEELARVLAEVREPWRAWVVLGAFAGLRPEEIAPMPTSKKKGKRGLMAQEIDWKFKVIHLPSEVSKVGYPRRVPISEACMAWLRWAGITETTIGPVCSVNPTRAGETARLGDEVFLGKWPQDVLRHSYGSYRNAQLRNMPQVAEEMGTSVTMLHRHYHNPQPQELGEEWFSLLPSDPKRSDQNESASAASE
jgi:integrase